jgi:hypothetical protein
MSQRKLRLIYCWSHLPRKFPPRPRMEIVEEEGQPMLIFPDTYRARRQWAASSRKEAADLMRKQGSFRYNDEKKCWEIHDAYDKPIAMRCGEYFEIQLGKRYLPCRLELDREWFIYLEHNRFYLHPKMHYVIRGI